MTGKLKRNLPGETRGVSLGCLSSGELFGPIVEGVRDQGTEKDFTQCDY